MIFIIFSMINIKIISTRVITSFWSNLKINDLKYDLSPIVFLDLSQANSSKMISPFYSTILGTLSLFLQFSLNPFMILYEMECYQSSFQILRCLSTINLSFSRKDCHEEAMVIHREVSHKMFI